MPKKEGMKRKVITDIVQNLLSAFIPLGLLQLVILPSVSKSIGGDKYGLVLTLVALLNTVPASFGNALNNIRLLKDDEYRQKNLSGDFNYLVLTSTVVSILIILVMTLWYEQGITWNVLLTLVLSVMWLLRDYYIVEFRIHLNYRNVLKDNLLLSLGYLSGFMVFKYIFPIWQFIYIFGFAFSLLFLSWKTSLWRESFQRTTIFPSTLKDTLYILGAGLLTRLTTYSEKLIIYPVLGGTAVAVYYAASIFGKLISAGISPITSVLLSYVSKMSSKPRSLLRYILLVGGGIGSLGFIIINFLGEYVLGWLYPEYLAAALPMIKYAAMDAVLNTIIVMINPFVLRFNKIKWQIIIGGITGVVYLLSAALLSGPLGLTGYFLSLIIAHGLKLIVLLLLLSKNPSTNEPV